MDEEMENEEKCLFCKIRDKEIAASFVYEDDTVMAFPDIHPQKPIHILVVPKQHVKEFVAVENHELFTHLSRAIQQLIRERKLDETGYQIRINGGGHQDVDHLHLHLLGPMGSAS